MRPSTALRQSAGDRSEASPVAPPWAETLFEALDSLRDADFELAMDRASDRRQSPDAVAAVERTHERVSLTGWLPGRTDRTGGPLGYTPRYHGRLASDDEGSSADRVHRLKRSVHHRES